VSRSPNLVEDFTNFAKFYQRQGERLATVEIIRLAAQGNERDFQILAAQARAAHESPT
jgi:hypothetical protein